MIRVLAPLCLFALAALGEADSSLSNLSVVLQNNTDYATYDYTTYDFAMPKTLDEINERKWEKLNIPSYIPVKYTSGLTMYSNTAGHSLCLFVNASGNVCGFHVGFKPAIVHENEYDTATQGFSTWSSSVNGTPVDYIATYIIWFDAESKIVFPGINGEVMEISTYMSENPDFTKHRCKAEVGTYYFWKMTSATTCAASSILPIYFTAGNNGKYNGFGVYLCARQEQEEEDDWTWFVNWPSTIVKTNMIDPPSCMDEYAALPGYFGLEARMGEPSTTTCESS